jgi:hypothetical protein
LARQDPRLDVTDMFVFPGDRGTVFVMDVNSSAAGPDAPDGFHPEARYEFKVHFDGGAYEEITYRITFDEPDASGQQAYRLHTLSGLDARDDDATGELVLEGRTGGDMARHNGVRLWAGRAADPFYIDLDRLGPVNAAVRDGAKLNPGSWRPEQAKDSFAGATIAAIVLEISDQHPRLGIGAHIGVWCTSKLATDGGGWRQINRFGHPMMWPIFRPDDTEYASDSNRGHPADDMASEREHLAHLVAAVVAANGTSDDPAAYGQIVVRLVLPDIMSYVVGTPAIYGFGVRNGRALADNAPEVMFSLVFNSAIASGLTPAVKDQARDSKFPYLVAS